MCLKAAWRIGNLKRARQAGDPKIKNFNYEWNLPAEKGAPATLVNARGRGWGTAPRPKKRKSNRSTR